MIAYTMIMGGTYLLLLPHLISVEKKADRFDIFVGLIITPTITGLNLLKFGILDLWVAL